jgi:hypothetical protein
VSNCDEPCYFCGEKTNSVAGNPAEWPLFFPEADKPGVVRPHHMGCVFKRLGERNEAIALAQRVHAEWRPHERSMVAYGGWICRACDNAADECGEIAHESDCLWLAADGLLRKVR